MVVIADRKHCQTEEFVHKNLCLFDSDYTVTYDDDHRKEIVSHWKQR